MELPERVYGLRVEQSTLDGDDDSLRAIVGLELQQDLLYVHFHCVFCHKDQIGNFFIALPF